MAHHHDLELESLSSPPASPAFPTFYRRDALLRTPTSTDPIRKPSEDSSKSLGGDTEHDVTSDRVEYAPVPEKKKLGYFSTAALIVSKMIGTGVFAKPSVVLANSGGRGVSLFLWVACGIMSLMG